MRTRIAILALCAALGAGVLAAGSEGDSDSASTSARAIVGEVIAVSDGKLRVKANGEGSADTLQEGDDLRLGDEILPGRGVRARLKLKAPRGASDEQLVYVDATKAEPHTVTLTRTGNRETKVEIRG